jgi:AMIN domain
MDRSLRAAAGLLAWAAVCFAAPVAGQAQGVPSIRRVQVLRTPNLVEIEIEASDHLVPRTNVLTSPDRLVVDFVNAVPGAQLRNQVVNRGEVKSVRVGLFSSNPPVTRIVLDLNGPQHYQVFPSGRTVIVKVGGSAGAETAGFHAASGPVLVNTNYPAQTAHLSVPLPPARPPLKVSFQDGLLSISSNKATLSEVLFAVHQRTGAEIAIPAGAEEEIVMGDLGPAPAPVVLAHLLNGSKFNFLILSSSSDPRALDRVILSSRPEGPMPAPRPQLQPVSDDDDEADAPPKVAPPSRPAPPPVQNPNPSPNSPTDRQVQPGASPETKTPPNNDIPD